jgi:hypothetical protein
MANLFGQPKDTAQQGFGNDLLSYYTDRYGYVPPNAFGYADAFGGSSPALANTAVPMPGALSNTVPGYMSITEGRRSQAPLAALPERPNRQIGLNEALIRIGGSGVEGAMESGPQSFANMTKMYGSVEDYNRSRALEDYNAAVTANLRGAQAQKALGSGKGNADTAANAANSKEQSSNVVNDAGMRALDIINADISDGGWMNDYFTGSTGWAGMLSGIPNSNAKALGNLITTIQGNAGFDKLQAMREASPTGGALGQVSTIELKQLNAAFGNLDQTNSPEELKYNLQNLLFIYNNIIHGTGNHNVPAPGPMGSGPQGNPSDDDKFKEADKIVQRSR